MRDNGLIRQQSQINKIKPWLEKIRIIQRNNSLVKSMKTKDSPFDELNAAVTLDDSDEENMQNEQLKKVKVLKILKEKMQVSGNEYIKAQDIQST
jgi:hypothetical protein